MLVSNIPTSPYHFYLITELLTYHPLSEEILTSGRGTQRDLYDTTTISLPHQGLGAQ